MKRTEAEQTEARERLLKILKSGDTIYTITRHVSRSGMMRRISAFIVKDNKIIDLDWQIAQTGLFDRKYPEEGLVVGGCGMDMHFHVVYELGRVLFPDGFAEPCVKCGHPKTNEWVLGMCPVGQCQFRGRNSDTSGFETDGGYAFKKESL